jgi:transcriptional regulator GlxA family with amidase domain
MASETKPPKQPSSSTTTSTSTTTTHIGVLLLPPVQLLDLSAIDLLGMLSPSYLQACPLPAALIALAHPVRISYICASGADTLAALTASCSINVTHGLSSPEVQPGKLDVLMIPGPDPNGYPSSAEKAFMRGHANDPTCDVLTVCTGVKPAACAGILDGKTVTGPRALVGQWSKEFPEVRWVEKRWCRDGRVWTSGE